MGRVDKGVQLAGAVLGQDPPHTVGQPWLMYCCTTVAAAAAAAAAAVAPAAVCLSVLQCVY
jgi:hypothetical protein